MATSQVGICNRALALISVDPILSITDDSEEARRCNLLWDESLDEMLTEHEWNFATARATLAQLSTTPAFGFDLEYQLPVDPYCLSVRRTDDSTDVWKIEGRKLLTDETTMEIVYTKRVTDINELPAQFIKAFVYYFAHQLSFVLTNSRSLSEAEYVIYTRSLQKAKLRDSQEGSHDVLPETSWTTARR